MNAKQQIERARNRAQANARARHDRKAREWGEAFPGDRPAVTCSHCGEEVRDADSFPLSFGGNACAPCFNRCNAED